MKRLAILSGLIASILPMPAFAALNLEQDIITVGNGLSSFFGGGGSGATLLNNFAAFLAGRLLLLAGITATFMIVKAGLAMINSTDEGKYDKAKRQIQLSIVAIVLGYLSERFVLAAYGPATSPATALLDPLTSVGILDTETQGIISWVLELMVIVSILIICTTAFRILRKFGKEDGGEQIRNSVLGAFLGFLLLGLSSVIQMALGLDPGGVELAQGPVTASPILERIIGMTQNILEYMAVIAVAIVVYAAVKMIVMLGNEDEYSKSKQLIFRVLLGLFIILVSYVMTALLKTLLGG